MLDRRTFLRLSAGGALLGLTGCAQTSGRSSGAPAAGDPSDAVARIAPAADESLNVASANFELLTGPDQTFAFGLSDIDNEPIKGADVDLFVVAPSGDTSGPYRAEFHDIEHLPHGAYITQLDLTEVGPTWFVVVTRDGEHAGRAAVTVADPANSQLAATGDEAIRVATPTFGDHRGVDKVCTLQPPCGMHETSLDDALRAGQPVMLTFATPAYCQTAMCGPAVDVIDAVRQGDHARDAAWIHVEIYRDAGKTLSKAVQQWELPSEPWLFAISEVGIITARADGALLVVPSHVERIARTLA